MSIEQIPQKQWYKIFDTDEIIKVGSFTSDVEAELQHLMHYFFIHGTLSGTERFRSIIYSDENHTSAMYVSEWSDFLDIENLAAYWQGWVRSDFARQHIKLGREYFVGIEINNYVRNAMTYYIAAKFDYDNSVYPKVSTNISDYPISTRYFFYKERDQ